MDLAGFNNHGPKTLLIPEKSFDDMIEAGSVEIIGCYMDLRSNTAKSNPYIEYVIKPKAFYSEEQQAVIIVENVIINQKDEPIQFIDYPYDVPKK